MRLEREDVGTAGSTVPPGGSGEVRGRRAGPVLGLALAGTAGSVWCFSQHICMDGHMRHPPYPGWHYALDAGWAVTLVVAGVLSLNLRRWPWRLLGAALLLLVPYRFILESPGGAFSLPI